LKALLGESPQAYAVPECDDGFPCGWPWAKTELPLHTMRICPNVCKQLHIHKGGMSHRVNILLEDELWRVFQAIPKGERSRVINRALAAWVKTSKRDSAARRMDEIRRRLPPVRTEEIVEWVRADRARSR
jgi:hypothetical protein